MKHRISNYFKQLNVKSEIKNVLLVALGCFLLALADALFIVPSNIVNGGIDSLAIILNYALKGVVDFDFTDIIIGGTQAILWIISLLLLGKKFSIHTLLGSLLFPLFYSVLLRINILDLIGMNEFYLNNTNSSGNLSLSFLIISGVLGGVLSGAGVALAYLGEGSTGGLDVVSFLMAKYTKIQEDISGLIMDTAFIIAGLFIFKSYELALCGILSALVCAFLVQIMYINNNSYLIYDIITTKETAILEFIHDTLKRGTTLLDSVGGHSKIKHQMIEVVISSSQADQLQKFIAFTDPKAFVQVIEAKNIKGKGFSPFTLSNRAKKEMLKKYGVSTKD